MTRICKNIKTAYGLQNRSERRIRVLSKVSCSKTIIFTNVDKKQISAIM